MTAPPQRQAKASALSAAWPGCCLCGAPAPGTCHVCGMPLCPVCVARAPHGAGAGRQSREQYRSR